MKIKYHKEFVKNYKKRISSYPKLVSQFKIKLKLFIDNPNNPMLKNHKLTGKMQSFRAFSLARDIRVVYRIVGDEVWLYDIGSHDQVY